MFCSMVPSSSAWIRNCKVLLKSPNNLDFRESSMCHNCLIRQTVHQLIVIALGQYRLEFILCLFWLQYPIKLSWRQKQVEKKSNYLKCLLPKYNKKNATMNYLHDFNFALLINVIHLQTLDRRSWKTMLFLTKSFGGLDASDLKSGNIPSFIHNEYFLFYLSFQVNKFWRNSI